MRPPALIAGLALLAAEADQADSLDDCFRVRSQPVASDSALPQDLGLGCEIGQRSAECISWIIRSDCPRPMISRRRTSPPLPKGTVTFLFTDIEGSTRLWETQRAAMQKALARHDALLRQVIERHHGHVVKTTGDGAFAAFASATDALEASIAAQQALGVESWPDAVRIRVRIALHSGPAEFRDGDYFGPTLNRAARLLALGHGGQTLVSAITHDLCRDYLPPGVSLRNLGEHGLKDMDRREVVFELCHTGLPEVFPPLKKQLVPSAENVPSIAVLPFVNISRDEENEYFADGLAEELLNVLSKIRGLRVASRTSAFSFRRKDVDIPTIAQKLNVATILEGSVRKAGKRVRITAQLVHVATDSHLWSETYDRALEDIFAVQDDIAQSVVRELRAALLGEKPDASANAAVKTEVGAAAKGRGSNAEAYRLYLQGRFFEDRLTRLDTTRAIEYYRQALKIDPAYALAWTGLSRSYGVQASFSLGTTGEGFGKAREAAERAAALEPDLVEGHVALGWVRLFLDWDWKEADRLFRRALELAPRDTEALRGTAILAEYLGRLDDAIGLLRRAAELDPLSVWAHRSLAACCLRANLLDEAEAAATKALELNPEGGLGYHVLGLVYLTQRRPEEAFEMFRREGHEIFRLFGLVLGHHACGRPGDADVTLEELIEKHAAGGAFQIAEACAYRGEADRAFEWLERAYAQRNPGLGRIKVSPLLKNLYGDLRWQPFLIKMGLAD